MVIDYTYWMAMGQFNDPSLNKDDNVSRETTTLLIMCGHQSRHLGHLPIFNDYIWLINRGYRQKPWFPIKQVPNSN